MHIRRSTGGILLVSGTCIGAGMLALPITTASSGFVLSSLLLIACWLMTYLTGLFVLEANMCLPEGANFISMAKETLGRTWEMIAWLTYLLLLYSLMAAYLSAGGDIVRNFLSAISTYEIKDWIGPLPWVLVVATFILAGANFVDGFNRVLMAGLVLTYFLLLGTAVPHADLNLLKHGKPGYILAALPVVVTAFGYHVIIPGMRQYLRGNVNQLVRMILWGSLLPLIVYICWNFVVYSLVPIKGTNGLEMIYQMGRPATQLTHVLAELVDNPMIVSIAEGFIFFAIASSFLGIAFSLFGFLKDGLLVHHSHLGSLGIGLITFLPPLAYAIMFPRGFILALSYAGVFVAILHGILPAMMVYAARQKGMVKFYRTPVPTAFVYIVIAVSVLVIGAQFAVNLGYLHPFPS